VYADLIAVMRRRTYLLAAGSAVCCASPASHAGTASSSGNRADDTGEDRCARPDIVVSDCEFVSDGRCVAVTGTARNQTDRTLEYVEATARFLDTRETQVGEGFDSTTALTAGGAWAFECLFRGPEPRATAHYEVSVRSGSGGRISVPW
jgi:hypothetical protein